MGFEPTTLRDLIGCSNRWATEGSMVGEGQIVSTNWNRIARLHSHVLTHMNSLTASCCHIKAFRDASNQPPFPSLRFSLIHIWYPVVVSPLLDFAFYNKAINRTWQRKQKINKYWVKAGWPQQLAPITVDPRLTKFLTLE